MPYVMVPVPEEYVEEVMQFVLKAVARASVDPWGAESITELFTEVDELSRTLLSLIARGTGSGKELTEVDLAVMIQLSGRETIGIMRELNIMARDSNHPNLIIPRMISEALPNGRTMQKRVLTMADDIAQLVRDAERADMLTDPNPLDIGPG